MKNCVGYPAQIGGVSGFISNLVTRDECRKLMDLGKNEIKKNVITYRGKKNENRYIYACNKSNDSPGITEIK